MHSPAGTGQHRAQATGPSGQPRIPARGPLTFRRLAGLDRSGPPPPETLAGAPLRPWTIPNMVGYVRLALIPVFLVLAFGTSDGRSAPAAAVFGVIGWSDYLDGMLARITGQYSRMGVLLDPVCDRFLALSGFAVAWHFELLPRWAIAVLIGREAFMLFAGRAAVRRGAEIVVNWPGRLAVAPVLSAPFFAMCGVEWLALAFLYIGMALALTATVLYVGSVQRQLSAKASSSP